MPEKKFLQSLEKLDQALDQTQPATPAAQEKIDELRAQVKTALDQPPTPVGSHHQSLMATLQDSAEHFEVIHPRLTGVINEVMTALSNLGI